MTADQSAQGGLDEATGIGVPNNVISNHNMATDIASSSFRSPPDRKRSTSSTLTGVDPLDSSNPIPGHMPGSFPNSPTSPVFEGPSSAPPTPSVISVTHPSQFIHTHHPRRGSLTPLGLNVISPVPPQLGQYHQHPFDSGAGSGYHSAPFASPPLRTVGFNAPDGCAYSLEAARRDSVATVASSASRTSGVSNLTATRPAYSSGGTVAGASGFYRRSSLTPSMSSASPSSSQQNHSQQTYRGMGSTSTSTPLFDPSRRRGSLTPSLPTLSAASATRALASGKLSTKTLAGESPVHSSTADVLGERRSSAAALVADARRGSLPQLYYGAWTGPGDRRNSSDSQLGQATIKRGFKFGSINSNEPQDFEGAAGSLQRIAQLSKAKKSESSAFEAAEQAEAERQRALFLAATYGKDGARARARLSLGGSSTPASPASTRRQSLLLWERINQRSDGSVSTGQRTPAGPSTTTSSGDDLVGKRRPSLPVNIPQTPRAADHVPMFDDQTTWDDPDALPDAEEHPGVSPQRPLPPLLPLSDPVPRLLPSTLALHRASHLLNARNLASEPLPPPLPPSLHPPQPVDLTEFDIDFILAGSRSQLGRAGSKGSHRRSNHNGSRGSEEGIGGGGRPGLDEEDSFAKFVGAFDDEYGGRRAEWTFRALPRPAQPAGLNPTRPVPRAEWESHGAGKYEIYPSGDVRSVESGSVWRVKRTSTREYELEQPMPGLPIINKDKTPANAPQPIILSPCSGYTLASKLVHTENGGVKLPIQVQRELSRNSRFSRRFVAASRNRQSTTDSLLEADERRRAGSQDSGCTATAHAHLIQAPRPQPPAMRHHSSNASSNQSTNTPSSLSPPKDESHQHKRGGHRSRRGESSDDKKEKGFMGGLKRGLSRASNMIEESKERGKFWPNGSSGSYSLKSSSVPTHRPIPHHRKETDRSDSASASSKHSSKYTSESADEEQQDEMFGSLGLGIEDEQNGGHPWKEGKAWEDLPEDALAMVVPIESDKHLAPLPHTPAATKAFINPFFVDGPRQALLVWFIPFNSGSNSLDRPERQGSSTLLTITEVHHEEPEPLATSLSRLPKLLRPRGNRGDNASHSSLGSSKHVPSRLPSTPSPSDTGNEALRSPSRASHGFPPLPFKGYRVVAKVVDTEDLRSQSEIPVIPLEAWNEQLRTGKPAGVNTPPIPDPYGIVPDLDSGAGASAGLSASVADPSGSSSLASTSTQDNDSSIMSGRTSPTVIAVCHNQTSGVEFVLEGLDRLGLCKGESAWGPTGYEEWRGTGLSDSGRQMLDLLWAGCTAVMGV